MASNMSGTSSSNSSLYYDYYSDEYSGGYDSNSSMVSTNSTPNKQGATGVQHRTRDNMDAALQKDLFDRTLRDEPIEDFVKYVYGFTDDDAKYIGSNIWTLHSDGLKEFDTVLREGRPEKELYAPFKTIIDDLCTKFESDGYTLHIGLAPLGDEQLRGTGTPRKPDGLFLFESFKENVTKVSWALSKGFLEFGITPKKRRIRKEERRPRDRIVTIREETTSTPSASEVAIDVGATVSQNDLAPSPPLEIQSGSKRRSSDVPEMDEQRPSKRPKVITRKQSQAAGYALEMMASSCRRWVTGLVIVDHDVEVHYYDRIGAIFSQKFNFSEAPQKLAMLALALARCDIVQSGFEPLISANLDSPFAAPPSSMEGTVLRLPLCDGIDATYVKDIGKNLYSHFEITGNPLYAYKGLNGRGSFVFPGRLVSTVKETGAQPRKASTDVNGNITAAPKESDDVGSASGATNSGQPLSQVTMVAKLSWPLATRPNLEAELIHELRDKVERIRPHLPKVHFAMVLKGASLQLPRDLFHSMTTAHNLEQRYITLMIVDKYRHLWEVPTCKDFLQVYLDIVECHHAAMKIGHILHRDISDKNLLWRKQSRCVGVLNDWDLSSVVVEQAAHAKHRTGTGPFMALDLLTENAPPCHLYRHDLESLFYVFVWAAVNYTLDKEKPFASKPNPDILKWAGTYADAHEAKKNFLSDPQPVFHGVQAAFKPLRSHLRALWELFHESFEKSVKRSMQLEEAVPASPEQDLWIPLNEEVLDSDEDELPVIESHLPPVQVNPPPLDESEIDFETMGGCLTFEKFLAALGQRPRQYNSWRLSPPPSCCIPSLSQYISS